MTTGQTFPWDSAGSEPRGKVNKTSKSKSGKSKAPTPTRKGKQQSNGLLAALNEASKSKRRAPKAPARTSY